MPQAPTTILNYESLSQEPQHTSVVPGFIAGWLVGGFVGIMVLSSLIGGIGSDFAALFGLTAAAGLPVLGLFWLVTRSSGVGNIIAFTFAFAGSLLVPFVVTFVLIMAYECC